MTHLGFDGKVAVVTGAGGGLGRQHAMLLASRGAQIVVNDIGGSVTGDGIDADPAETVVDEIRDLGGTAVADTNSVATPEGGAAIVRTALEAYGRLDVLVNNAGILRDAPFEAMTSDLLDPVVDVHLRGAFHVTGPAWIAMRAQGYGRIVNTTSAAGILGTETKSNYGAAKAGLVGLTRVLAQEGARHGIKVNAVAPIAATRMLAHSVGAADERRLDPAAQAMMAAITARLDPALVSPVVAFLCHADCPVSGETYTAGAGQVATFFTGRTRGYHHPALSVEDVRDHLAEIRDETGFTTPASPGEEIAQLLRSIAGQEVK
ncbi:NAD(P)-dependent dehydrogenase, short-chain alcohol dehydrogenase family [Nocardioides sp. YR527]|uniref:SDR family NAD(P)-dependent oxidoreductase n=1 Tax=Nocardioides sp. YR527 TaxID=1881028 RepID=UPI00088AEF8B|nr:SDR family NAD(P)-dependent oxidoreductase [Nocardioides sp. YR527]SDK58050.1 NAD(P)-dependent dehydrogenase, short-chain alcohol dehydrogenase family [Nocardioides sp. YR527]